MTIRPQMSLSAGDNAIKRIIEPLLSFKASYDLRYYSLWLDIIHPPNSVNVHPNFAIKKLKELTGTKSPEVLDAMKGLVTAMLAGILDKEGEEIMGLGPNTITIFRTKSAKVWWNYACGNWLSDSI